MCAARHRERYAGCAMCHIQDLTGGHTPDQQALLKKTNKQTKKQTNEQKINQSAGEI